MSGATALYIGVDVGSSGCKVAIVDGNGRVVASASETTATLYPRPGWVEQDPDEWVRAARVALRASLAGLSDSTVADVAAISFSGPTHVAVLVDVEGRPVRPAIMWNDQRSGAEAAELERSHGDLLRRLSGNSVSATWTIAHLRWLRTHEPDALAATARVTFLKDWVREYFSPATTHVTDYVDAEGAMLVDVADSRWSPELVELSGMRVAQLPEIVEPSFLADSLDPALAAEFGLPVGVAVVTGSTDTAMELLAAGIAETGTTAVKLATAGNVARTASARPAPSRDIVYRFLLPGTFYVNSATSSAAASMRWVGQLLGSEHGLTYEQLDALAGAAAPGAGGLLFTPYLSGERSPHWDPELRGSLIGLTHRTGPGHVARAVMEGVAFSLRDAAAGNLPSGTVTLVGGGAQSRVWPQIIADVLGVSVRSAPYADSSVGAAIWAARAVGSELRLSTSSAEPVRPDAGTLALYARMFELYRALAEATRQLSHDLAEVSAP